MKDVTMSLWFWFLILGTFLVLLAAILSGGLNEVNGWIWTIFIVGIVLAILGIILAVIEWTCDPYEYEYNQVSDCPKSLNSSSISSDFHTSQISSPVTSPISSPMHSPSKISSNIPQAQRGFATSNLSISSLAPSN